MTLKTIITFGLICCANLIQWNALAQEIQPEVCRLARKPGGLTSMTIEGIEIGNGDHLIDKLPVGNEVGSLVWSCPGSGSKIPADSCTLKLTIPSSNAAYILEEQRIHVVNFKERHYAITGRRRTENGPVQTDVYRIDLTGFRKLCSITENERALRRKN